jgi:hypothetical protein
MLDDLGSAKVRHQRFVRRVVELGKVWGLHTDDGWVVSPSNDGERSVMPFWSDRAYAAQCAADEWHGYEPTAIPLQSFLEQWLPGMANDDVLVGTNWNAQLIGVEVAPADLLRELTDAARGDGGAAEA